MLQRPTPRLVVASGSASRRELLAGAGLEFAVQPASVDEAAIKLSAQYEGMGPGVTALRLADAKAAAVAVLDAHALVIGADQILVCGDAWFDKPVSIAAAREQLNMLRGRSHELVTAVVCHQGSTRLWSDIAIPRLTMRAFGAAFLEAYLAAEGGSVTTTVGAYRLEGLGAHLFTSVEGEHAAILGLPLLSLLAFLRRFGILLD
jgi:septum formation protein